MHKLSWHFTHVWFLRSNVAKHYSQIYSFRLLHLVQKSTLRVQFLANPTASSSKSMMLLSIFYKFKLYITISNSIIIKRNSTIEYKQSTNQIKLKDDFIYFYFRKEIINLSDFANKIIILYKLHLSSINIWRACKILISHHLKLRKISFIQKVSYHIIFHFRYFWKRESQTNERLS